MGIPDTSKAKGKYGKMIVTARNLVAAVMASARKAFGQAGEKLFGIANPFCETFQGEAVIEGDNIAQFLTTRTNRFGIAVTLPKTLGGLNDAIITIAKQLVEKTGTVAGLNAQQIKRIAVEYVTQACVVPVAAIEPFGTYIARAQDYRTAMKALNKAEQAANPEAFANAKDPTAIEKALAQGRNAWAKVQQYLAESAHLAALRTQIGAPLLFTGIEAWQEVAALAVDTRLAVLDEIRVLVQQRGNPYVDTATVQQAIARVAGSQLLTGGNEFGVTVETAIEAMTSSRAMGIVPNGGTQVGFDRTPTHAFGATIGGLNGYVSGKATRKDGRTIGYAFDVTEGVSPLAPFTVPIAVTAPRQQQYA